MGKVYTIALFLVSINVFMRTQREVTGVMGQAGVYIHVKGEEGCEEYDTYIQM